MNVKFMNSLRYSESKNEVIAQNTVEMNKRWKGILRL